MVEDKLIRAAQSGNAKAFSALLSLVYDVIYRFAFKWAGNKHNAEDITQQACIKLAKVIKQFRFESAFTTWLYRLVLNCANDWGRAEKRHCSPQGSSGVIPPEQPDSGGATQAFTELACVLKQVDSMGRGFKDTLLLVLAEGMTHAEAASILEIKESTVSWRMHEIRKQLKIIDEAMGASS